jgi:hypothetical protein
MLLNPCGNLPNFFKLHPDGVIQHLASGMCFQGIQNGDPLKTAHGDRVTLNYPCTLYRPGYNTPHALQFKFTRGGSLMEIKSGKCISSNQGQANVALTFSTLCDNVGTIIGFIGWYIRWALSIFVSRQLSQNNFVLFIDKGNKVLYPQKVGKSPTKTPSTPGPPSTPTGNSPPKVPQPPTSPPNPLTPGTPSPPSPAPDTAPPVTAPPGTAPPITKPENYGRFQQGYLLFIKRCLFKTFMFVNHI